MGSVLVTNLVTGSRKGGWEGAEVLLRYCSIEPYVTSVSISLCELSSFATKWEAASSISS